MDNNINLAVIAANRKPISIVGGTLGTQFFKAEARASIQKFDDLKLKVEQGNNVDFCLNRTPRRYRFTGHDILSAEIKTDATNATKVVLNKDTDSQVSIPVSPGMERIGVVTDDALGKALRGDNNIIFSDAKKLANELNIYNNDEKNRLIRLRDEINRCISQLDSAINENNKKAEQYVAEILNSTPTVIPNPTIEVNIDNGIVVKDDKED